jgi:hypothetical protein
VDGEVASTGSGVVFLGDPLRAGQVVGPVVAFGRLFEPVGYESWRHQKQEEVSSDPAGTSTARPSAAHFDSYEARVRWVNCSR